jgi:hypothetical protein
MRAMRLIGGPASPGPGSLIGLLSGVTLGTLSITLLFLAMRAVMDIGGACADGGPFVPVRPCPDGVPLAMIGGMFGLFGSAGLLILFGPRFGPRYAALPLLGWPALFLSLGWNFIDYGVRAPDGSGELDLGWVLSGVVFLLTGGVPLVIAILAVKAARILPRVVPPGTPAWSSGFGAQPPPQGFQRPSSPPRAWTPPAGADDLTARLERLAELRRRGDLDEAEFSVAKRRLLGDEGAEA